MRTHYGVPLYGWDRWSDRRGEGEWCGALICNCWIGPGNDTFYTITSFNIPGFAFIKHIIFCIVNKQSYKTMWTAIGNAHDDTNGSDAHCGAHSDAHDDVHSDVHSDAHCGAHSDVYCNDAHSDVHCNDAHCVAHSDVYCNDAHCGAHSDAHVDVHSDVHSDVHCNDAHCGVHIDAHNDAHCGAHINAYQ